MKEINEMTFEEALSELEQIVKNIESCQTNLDDAIKNFERASLLKKYCEKKLKEAKLKVEKIVKKEDGSIDKEEITNVI